jgi:hypothetical protein
MPKDSPLIRVCISSENPKSTTKNQGYYVGSTVLQASKEEEVREVKKNRSITHFQAIQTQRKYAPSKSMKSCGLTLKYDYKKGVPVPVSNKGENNKVLEFTIGEKGVSVSGVGYCNNVFCQNCMDYVRPQRIEKLKQGLRHSIHAGHKAYFVTLTVPRSRTCRTQVDMLHEGWKGLQDRIRYRLKKQGITKYQVRNLDVTFKPQHRHVYHCHLHCVIILDKPLKPYNDKKLGYIGDFPSLLEKSWVLVQKRNGTTCSLQGQHIEEIKEDVGLSRYLNKFEGMAHELLNFQHKKGKSGNLTDSYKSIGFMELLGYCYKGDKKAIRIYRTFLRSMKNVRTNQFSNNWLTKEKTFNKVTFEEEEEITHYCDVPVLPPEEEEEEKEEKETMTLTLSWGWVCTLYDMGAMWTMDRFKVLLHHAYLHDELEYVAGCMEGYPCKGVILRLFSYYKVFNI